MPGWDSRRLSKLWLHRLQSRWENTGKLWLFIGSVWLDGSTVDVLQGWKGSSLVGKQLRSERDCQFHWKLHERSTLDGTNQTGTQLSQYLHWIRVQRCSTSPNSPAALLLLLSESSRELDFQELRLASLQAVHSQKDSRPILTDTHYRSIGSSNALPPSPDLEMQ